jgi:hypothetical protein
VKSAEEIMNILEAYDLTGSLRDAGELAGCSHHTVARYVRAREEGRLVPGASAPRPGVIDAFLPKLEELVERSKGNIRADVAHEKITAMGYAGSERTTRRAVARLKKAWHSGRRRVFRPWIPEPGMRAQYDFGDGPEVNGAATVLFCLWLAWSRFRVVLPLLDKTQASVWAAAGMALRRAGGVPAYLLTDNEKTVTVEHVAGIPVRNPGAVEFGRHYGLTVATCVPYDPASKGGSESTVKLAKADLVPTAANLLGEYGSFTALEAACAVLCEQVNARPHRVTRKAPAEMLADERARLHPVPAAPFTAALGVTRRVDAMSHQLTELSGVSCQFSRSARYRVLRVRGHGERRAGVAGSGRVDGSGLRVFAGDGQPAGSVCAGRPGGNAGCGGHGVLPRSAGGRAVGCDRAVVWHGSAAMVPVPMGGRGRVESGNAV